MAQKDPAPPKGRLEEGERVVAFLRRRKLENVLTWSLIPIVGLFILATLRQWDYGLRLGLFAVVILAGVPMGIVISTHHWLTDRRVLRSVVGVVTSWPLEGLTPRVTKGAVLGDDVRFEDAEGSRVVEVRAVDNAPEVLAAHAGLAAPAPVTGAEAPPAGEPAPAEPR